MSTTVDIKGGKRLKRKLTGFERRFRRIQARKINHWTDQLRDAVRLGSFFKNPTPNLQQSVWSARSRRSGSSEIVGQAGWGVDYGPILEFGVSSANQKGWEIKAKTPKGLRWLNRKTGKVVGGNPKNPIMSVWHPWNYGAEGSGPHWSKVLDKMRPRIIKDLSATVKEAFDGR